MRIPGSESGSINGKDRDPLHSIAFLYRIDALLSLDDFLGKFEHLL